MVKTKAIAIHIIGFNLQLFANLNTNVTTANTTGNDLSPEMKTFYDKNLLENAKPKLIHAQFGQKRNIPKNGGKTIEFRRFSPLPKAMTPLTEGVTPNGNKLNVTAITATIAQYGDYIVQSDLLELTSLDNTIAEGTMILGDQAGRTLDTVVREKISSGGQVYFPNKTVSGASVAVTARDELDMTAKPTLKDFFKIAAILKGNNAKVVGNGNAFVALVHPHVLYDVMTEAKDSGSWLDINKYSNPDAVFTGEVGKIANIRFVDSTEAKIWKDETCPTYTVGTGEDAEELPLSVYSTLIIAENAYGVTNIEGAGLETIVNQKGSGEDPLKQRSSVGWKSILTAEILSDSFMVRMESCSEFSKDSESN